MVLKSAQLMSLYAIYLDTSPNKDRARSLLLDEFKFFTNKIEASSGILGLSRILLSSFNNPGFDFPISDKVCDIISDIAIKAVCEFKNPEMFFTVFANIVFADVVKHEVVVPERMLKLKSKLFSALISNYTNVPEKYRNVVLDALSKAFSDEQLIWYVSDEQLISLINSLKASQAQKDSILKNTLDAIFDNNKIAFNQRLSRGVAILQNFKIKPNDLNKSQKKCLEFIGQIPSDSTPQDIFQLVKLLPYFGLKLQDFLGKNLDKFEDQDNIKNARKFSTSILQNFISSVEKGGARLQDYQKLLLVDGFAEFLVENIDGNQFKVLSDTANRGFSEELQIQQLLKLICKLYENKKNIREKDDSIKELEKKLKREDKKSDKAAERDAGVDEITKAKSEIQKLKDANQELQQKQRELEDRLIKLLDQVSQLEKQAKGREDKIKSQEDKINKLEQEIKNLKSDKSKADAEKKAAIEDLESKIKKLEREKADLAREQSKVLSSDQKLTDVSKRAEQLAQENSALRNQNGEILRQLAQAHQTQELAEENLWSYKIKSTTKSILMDLRNEGILPIMQSMRNSLGGALKMGVYGSAVYKKMEMMELIPEQKHRDKNGKIMDCDVYFVLSDKDFRDSFGSGTIENFIQHLRSKFSDIGPIHVKQFDSVDLEFPNRLKVKAKIGSKEIDMTIYSESYEQKNRGWKFNHDRFEIAWAKGEEFPQLAINNIQAPNQDQPTLVDALKQAQKRGNDWVWQVNPSANNVWKRYFRGSGAFVMPDEIWRNILQDTDKKGKIQREFLELKGDYLSHTGQVVPTKENFNQAFPELVRDGGLKVNDLLSLWMMPPQTSFHSNDAAQLVQRPQQKTARK